MRDGEVILPAIQMVRKETAGMRLSRARLEAGLSYAKLASKIEKEFRAEIGESTIRSIEQDIPPNPGIKTIELICRGLGLPPLEVFALMLDEPPAETTNGFTESRFAEMWKEYLRAPAGKRGPADMLIEMVISQLRKL